MPTISVVRIENQPPSLDSFYPSSPRLYDKAAHHASPTTHHHLTRCLDTPAGPALPFFIISRSQRCRRAGQNAEYKPRRDLRSAGQRAAAHESKGQEACKSTLFPPVVVALGFVMVALFNSDANTT